MAGIAKFKQKNISICHWDIFMQQMAIAPTFRKKCDN